MGALVRGRDMESRESTISLELQGGKRQRPAWVRPGYYRWAWWRRRRRTPEGWDGDLEKGKDDDQERV